MYALYTFVTDLLVVLASPYFVWRGLRTGKYFATFGERMGMSRDATEAPAPDGIWVHAVSVGEVLAARPLVARLKQRFPERPVFVSTTTLTGNAVARQSLSAADALFYAPFDWPRPVRRALTRLHPRLLVLVETELWPNLIHEARRRGTRVAVVNGRISPRSLRRYLWVRQLLSRVLENVDLFLMQSDAHADRIRQMGAPVGRVRTSGNLKFDLPPASGTTPLAALIPASGMLLVAGSTTAGEEDAVLAAFRALRAVSPDARLVVAPRHPERWNAVLDLIGRDGWSCARRSALTAPWTGSDVLLLDTMGELAGLYSLATIAFVGGSLVPIGGHNILEVAAYGKPIVVGPHMHNFQEIAELFRAEQAMVQVSSAGELPGAVVALAGDAARRAQMGERGKALLERHRGAVDRTVDALAELIA